MNIVGNRKNCKDVMKDKGKVLIEKRIKYYWFRRASLYPDLYLDEQELEKSIKDIMTNLWFRRCKFLIKNALSAYD